MNTTIYWNNLHQVFSGNRLVNTKKYCKILFSAESHPFIIAIIRQSQLTVCWRNNIILILMQSSVFCNLEVCILSNSFCLHVITCWKISCASSLWLLSLFVWDYILEILWKINRIVNLFPLTLLYPMNWIRLADFHDCYD